MLTFNKAISIYHEDVWPYLNCPNKKPWLRQAKEMASLAAKYRSIPYQYVRNALYDRAFSDEIADYLPPRLIYSYALAINGKDGTDVAKDKVAFRRALAAKGLPIVTEILSTDSNKRIFDGIGREINRKQALDLIQEHGGDIFVKPVRGIFGRGAHLLKRGEIPADFPGDQKNLLVQPVLRQHPVLKAIYPHAINTVRIDTLRTENGIISNAAVLRMGVGGSVVDNGAAGGIMAGIDLETGRLRPVARRKAKYSHGWFERHPDTGAVFGNVTVPFWSQIREVVVRAAEALPLASLGWDVAVTPEGPVLIECNHTWCVNVMQIGWGGLGRTELGRRVRRFHRLPMPPERESAA